jgi:hypothetical protein
LISYPVIKVDRRSSTNLETLGRKEKIWIPHPDTGVDWLFKIRQTGEDWAEKIACELCERLGIPHVHYELAIELSNNALGVICPNVAAPPKTLILGNQLLGELNDAYPMDEESKYGVRQHTIAAVAEVIEKLAIPATPFSDNLPGGVHSAMDVYTGYLLLDALIANQDRHHQNWGAIRDSENRLAPSFDHGASLARNEPDEKRFLRLNGPDPGFGIEKFARNARSSLYARDSDKKTLITLEAYRKFAERCPSAAHAWQERLHLLQAADFETIVERIPDDRMSRIAKDFTTRLLLINQRRILES